MNFKNFIAAALTTLALCSAPTANAFCGNTAGTKGFGSSTSPQTAQQNFFVEQPKESMKMVNFPWENRIGYFTDRPFDIRLPYQEIETIEIYGTAAESNFKYDPQTMRFELQVQATSPKRHKVILSGSIKETPRNKCSSGGPTGYVMVWDN